jgi:hypothetical protein
MLDSQKMGAHEFIVGFKHGLYVCVSDTCQLCMDYKQDLKTVDSHHLMLVEVSTDEQKKAIYQIAGRTAFPITMGFWKNELKFVKLGQLFGEDLSSALKFLERFPKDPFTPEELAMLQKDVYKRCKLAYYVFPPGTGKEARMAALNAAFEHDELPMDVDKQPGLPDGPDDRVKALSGMLAHAKLVIFDIFKTAEYSEVATKLIAKFMEDKDYGETTVEHRTLQEAAQAQQS